MEWLSIVSTLASVIMLIYIIRRNVSKDSQQTEESFKKRIGRQVDEHEAKFARVEKCLIFLVEKAGGNAAEMGLYD